MLDKTLSGGSRHKGILLLFSFEVVSRLLIHCSMDMSLHSHDSQSSSSSSAPAISMHHQVIFFTSTSTPLYSSQWQPTSTGSYAGTCIFLISLAAILRCLFAGKHLLERRWSEQALARRYIRVRGSPTEAEKIDANKDGNYGTLMTAKGVEEHVKVVTNRVRPLMPWRLSVDLPRALYVTLTAGVGYLVCVASPSANCVLITNLGPRMLAVMTMNIGYFLSVLGGVFLGELAVGRYMQQGEH